MHPLADLRLSEVFGWLWPIEKCFGRKATAEEKINLAQADAMKLEENEEKKHENKNNQLNLPGTAAKGKSV